MITSISNTVIVIMRIVRYDSNSFSFSCFSCREYQEEKAYIFSLHIIISSKTSNSLNKCQIFQKKIQSSYGNSKSHTKRLL